MIVSIARKEFYSNLVSARVVPGFLMCLFLLSGCGKSTSPYETFSENLEPKQAAALSAFLDDFHEKYRMTEQGKTFAIGVPRARIEILKRYMTGPVDTTRCIGLIRGVFLSERDSSKTTLSAIPKKSERLMRMIAPSGEYRDSLHIGEAFDAVFEGSAWLCFRTKDNKIHVEFTGTIPENIRANTGGMRVVDELLGGREKLLLEVGPERSLWRFRWIVGIDCRSFMKESFRVIPGRFHPEGDSQPRESAYIGL
jgi:hypothetical protein